MKTLELTGSFGIDSLIFVDRPQPEPGPGQVLVRLHAWSLNYRDLLLVKGLYSPHLKLPFVPLSDGAGEIVGVGSGVTRIKMGDRVAGCFMQKWIDGEPNDVFARSALGGAIPGVAAEYVLLDAEGVVPIPAHLSYEEAASLPCAAVTAWHALVSRGNLKQTDTVLIQGTGGVSLFALQFARIVGARVIATSGSDEKLARVRQLGAVECINYRSVPEWGKKVRELTCGRGVDHVVEVGGAGTLGESLKAVRMGGRISLIGVLAGGGQVDPLPILMKSVTVQGIFVGSRTMFEAMNAAITQNQLHPIIDRAFSFGDIQSALRHMESGAHFGKIVLHV
jgi:NADPH:quinone reductase-like Zn-dependent oxidoreductase